VLTYVLLGTSNQVCTQTQTYQNEDRYEYIEGEKYESHYVEI